MLFNGNAFIHMVGPGITASVGTEVPSKIEGYGACFLDSVPLVYTADRSEQIGVNGQTGAIIWTNERIEISMTFRPSASTSQTAADGKSVLIRHGSKVELKDFTPVRMDTSEVVGVQAITDILNTVAATADSFWLTVGDTALTLSNSAPAEVQLVLRKYLKNQASLCTRVPV